MKNYKECNARDVLSKLEVCIYKGYARPIRGVYEDLSIFDWWVNNLTITHMKQMRTFLTTAIKEGYNGYVCFKVGASGCSNGMWAYKKPSTNGYSPDGDFLYRSFTPDYTEWECSFNGKMYPSTLGLDWNSCKTFAQLKKVLNGVK